jgi:hypothetical protein
LTEAADFPAFNPTNENLSVGVLVVHPRDEDPAQEIPVFNPGGKNLPLGIPDTDTGPQLKKCSKDVYSLAVPLLSRSAVRRAGRSHLKPRSIASVNFRRERSSSRRDDTRIAQDESPG